MLFRMIRGVLFHQRSKMLLIAVTIALGASLATGMLNVVMDVEDKVNKELKSYGANITVKPKDASLLSDIYDTGEGGALNAAYLREDELGKLKRDAQYSDRDIEDFVNAANKMLKDKGAKPIPMPKMVLRHVSLKRAAARAEEMARQEQKEKK